MIPRYRAWLKKDKEMIDVEEIHFNNGKLDFIGDAITWMCKNNDFVLMQSTGLTDKNGKEIFEGDILKVTDKHSWLEVVSYSEEKSMFVSKEINRKVEISENSLWDLFIVNLFRIEIIGNIWENPELVEVEQ